MTERVGVLGASSLVGGPLLADLVARGCTPIAFSRRAAGEIAGGIEWRRAELEVDRSHWRQAASQPIHRWISLMPMWVLPTYLEWLEAQGVRRLVAMSSTSVVTRRGVADPIERAVAQQLVAGEAALAEWAARRGVDYVILRPTMIYGLGRDRNVCTIARFILRFGFFPLLGPAAGRRQPVHARDVAGACLEGVVREAATNRTYDLSGAEVLSYRQMIERIFSALGRAPRTVSVPLWMFRIGMRSLRIVPRFRRYSFGMVLRMNEDMVFAHADAVRDLGFSPRPFRLARDELPS